MPLVRNVDLEPGEVYSAAEIRSTFGKGRAGKGIEINYDENDNKYIRLFSTPSSEYGDDLDADPMRYVGEKDFSNPGGDQVPNRGNGALIESQDHDRPVFLFEKVSEDPVQHRYKGRVRVVDYALNYRPSKEKKEFDFYLRPIDEDFTLSGTAPELDSPDDLVPGTMRDINTQQQELPESEETVSYGSNKEKQAEATNSHENTVDAVCEWLNENRWSCYETDETDILATKNGAVLVVEVKSVDGENDGKQIRKALGQLHENCYRDVVRRGWSNNDLVACLALSQPPADQYSGYIESLREWGIESVWMREDAIAGLPESVGLLCGAESIAER